MVKEILINPIENCIKEKNDKKYIIIIDTLRYDFDKYLKSLSKKDYAPCYIIRKDGKIHKLYDDSYYSNVSYYEKINKNSIFIALENAGQLEKNKNLYINWCNEIVNGSESDETIVQNNFNYYESYTSIQIESLGYMIIYLGNKYKLSLKEINKYNKDENSVVFLKDIDITSYSPNPSFNVEKLNSIIFKN